MSKFLDDYTLHQASIYELRDIARDLKIVPSTHRKEVLIEMIKKVLSGEAKPEMPKSRQGRPPRKKINSTNLTSPEKGDGELLSSTDVWAEAFEGNDEQKYDFSPVSEVGFNVLASPSFVYGDDIPKEKFGYFNVVNNKYYFLFEPGRIGGVDNIVSVYENYVKNYGLRPGDLVRFDAKRVSNIDGFALTEVKSINGNFLQNKSAVRRTFDDMPIKVDVPQKAFENATDQVLSTINLGDRCVFTSSNIFSFSSLLEMAKSTKAQDVILINLSIDTLPENAQSLKNEECVENFYTIFGDSAKQNKLAITLAVERAKRLAELGYNVIVAVNELKKIVKYQNFLLGNLAEDAKNGSLELCYQLFGCARRFETGSITILSLLKEKPTNAQNNAFDEILVSELENMNCKFFNL